MNRKNIEIILSKMTLEEKIALCSGKNFWETKGYKKYGIPSMQMCDGPHGLRKQNVCSIFVLHPHSPYVRMRKGNYSVGLRIYCVDRKKT